MAFSVTNESFRLANANAKEPQLILEIEGVPTILSTEVVLKYIKIGDEGLLIGDDWVIGGLSDYEDQEGIITFDGTTTAIAQQIDIDKGRGSSVSSIQVSLIDKNLIASELVSPGITLTEILSTRCKLYLGFKGSAFPEDYIVIFRGIVADVESGAGKVSITLSHPDTKKRQKLFIPKDTVLTAGIDDSVTTIPVESTTDFLEPMTGPDGLNDSSLKFHIKIDDEIIRYTSYDATNFLGCTRAQCGTVAAAHDDESQVDSFYQLTGNSVDLALKLMLSGVNDYFVEDVPVESFNQAGTVDYFANCIFFKDLDIERLYNVSLGDYVTSSGSMGALNDFTLKSISGIGTNEFGTYIIIDDVTLSDELDSGAVVSFRSQYDSLGHGLGMVPDEVDIDQHLEIQSRFLSSFDYDFYIKEEIDTKEFIEQEIYLPASAYSLPRKSQSSLGILSPPIPGEETIILDSSNIINPDQIKIKRSMSKNFLNTVLYKFDEEALEERFLKSVVFTDEDSKARIRAGNKVFEIKSKGMRSILGAVNEASAASSRRVERYKYAAEYLENIQVTYGIGYTIEVGDIIIADFSDIKVTDFTTGNREKEPALFQVINKKIDIKRGEVKLDLLNTGFSLDQVARYGLISPASKIRSSSSNSVFIIKPSYSMSFGENEGLKWSRYLGAAVIVRSPDYSIAGSAFIESVSYNQITLSDALAFTPLEDYVMELDVYNNQPLTIKLKYTFMRDTAFDDGRLQYTML